jgi:hypothetical protein
MITNECSTPNDTFCPLPMNLNHVFSKVGSYMLWGKQNQ